MCKGVLCCHSPAPLAVRLHQEPDWDTNGHTAPHMHLPMVTWFFFFFFGHMVSMVTAIVFLTGNEEGCISSLLHTHSLWCHFRYETGAVLWGKSWQVPGIQAAVRTFLQHQMSDGKPAVLADILNTASSLCVSHTTVGNNNNRLLKNKNKSLKINGKKNP